MDNSITIKVDEKFVKLFQEDPFLIKKDNFIKYAKFIKINFHNVFKSEKKNQIIWKDYSFNNEKFKDINDYIKKNHIKKINRSYQSLLNEYYWKLPDEIFKEKKIKNICAIGCGSGIELYFLRKQFPKARIVAVNWVDDIPKDLLKKLNVDFYVQNLYEYLSKNKSKFDLIFSNYVLEHSGEIDVLLKLIKESLVNSGITVNCIPLHYYNENSVMNKLRSFATNNKKFDNFDMSILDPGHAWKTNTNDIFYRTFLFSKTIIIGNKNNIVRYYKFNKKNWKIYLRVIEILNLLIYQPIIFTARIFFKLFKFKLIIKLFYKVEKKIFFSNYKLQNFVPSVLIVCFK